MVDLLYKKEVYDIVGAAMEVHKELGNGFPEGVYQEALAIEFEERNIVFEREKNVGVEYKGIALEKNFRLDFLCVQKIIVEIKALSELTKTHQSQVLNYLKATSLNVGLLINFGQNSLVYKRFVY
mgnify:FL=1